MQYDQRLAVSRRALLAASALAGLMPTLSLAQTGKKGGTLNSILSPEPPVLVLGVNNQGPTIIAASKIFQGLLRFSPKLDPLPLPGKKAGSCPRTGRPTRSTCSPV